MRQCIHQGPVDPDGTRLLCKKGIFLQPTVPMGFCDSCPGWTDRHGGKPRGLGDVVATVAKAAGVKQKKGCGCGSRQKTFNRVVPFGKQRAEFASNAVCVVTTAPRAEHTLPGSLQSLRHAGWEPVVFAEPESDVPDDVETRWNSNRLGVWHNWRKAAIWAVNRKSDYILTVQDDVVVHPDSRRFAESVLWPSERTGFLSLYTPKHYQKEHQETGVRKVRTGCLWGACALLWPREVLSAVLDHKLAQRWLGVRPRSGDPHAMERRREDPSRIQNSDTAIGKILNHLRREMWFLDPSPANHVAVYSSIGHGDNRGRRNCGRCADFGISLESQVPRPKKTYGIVYRTGDNR